MPAHVLVADGKHAHMMPNDGPLAGRPDDGDDIKSRRKPFQPPTGNKPACAAAQESLLVVSNGKLGWAEVFAAARAHLNKNKVLMVQADKVNFPAGAADVARENFYADMTPQMFGGEALATAAESCGGRRVLFPLHEPLRKPHNQKDYPMRALAHRSAAEAAYAGPATFLSGVAHRRSRNLCTTPNAVPIAAGVLLTVAWPQHG